MFNIRNEYTPSRLPFNIVRLQFTMLYHFWSWHFCSTHHFQSGLNPNPYRNLRTFNIKRAILLRPWGRTIGVYNLSCAFYAEPNVRSKVFVAIHRAYMIITTKSKWMFCWCAVNSNILAKWSAKEQTQQKRQWTKYSSICAKITLSEKKQLWPIFFFLNWAMLTLAYVFQKRQEEIFITFH